MQIPSLELFVNICRFSSELSTWPSLREHQFLLLATFSSPLDFVVQFNCGCVEV